MRITQDRQDCRPRVAGGANEIGWQNKQEMKWNIHKKMGDTAITQIMDRTMHVGTTPTL